MTNEVEYPSGQIKRILMLITSFLSYSIQTENKNILHFSALRDEN